MTEIGEILNGLRVVVQALRVSSRAAEKEAGLSGAQLFVLQQLSKARSLSVNELAARTHTHQSSVSVVVTKLVRDKLVSRSRSSTDGRLLVLSLTKRGEERLQRAPATAQDALLAGLRRMGPDERVLLAGSLSKLIRLAGFQTEAPSLFFEGLPTKGGSAVKRPKRAVKAMLQPNRQKKQ